MLKRKKRMIDSTTHQQWRKSAFYYLKQKFSNINESILEDGISQAYFQMWEDHISDEPSLSLSLSTLKHVAKCRVLDELRKYQYETSIDSFSKEVDYPVYDGEKDTQIEKIIERLEDLKPRERFLIEAKYKVQPLQDKSAQEIHDYRNQKLSDKTIATLQGYPSTGAVRAERKRGIDRLMSFF
jgi:hypothetical protein